MRKSLLFLALFWFLYAHKVNLFVYVKNNKVYCEGYYSDGKRVKGGVIEVYDQGKKKLLVGKTDEQGIFSFVPKTKKDLRIVLDAGIGHRAEAEIKAEELPIIEEENKAEKEAAEKIKKEELEKLVSEIIDEKLTPIYELLLKAEKEKNKILLREIISGIGYILGIFGIISLFLKRKNV
uniref:Uncharacterized protein n=1 Tax=candidate division WOR-3 bacterium TaxID=2052148 RepID=A0A7V6CNE8_UNCW3